MKDSILNSVKKTLGLPIEYDVFNTDVIMHINLAFSVLTQLGIDKEQSYRITSDQETWEDLFFGYETCIGLIKDYTYLKVRTLFDPPTTSFVLDALNNNIKEIEWRLQLQLECIDNIKKDSEEPKDDVCSDDKGSLDEDAEPISDEFIEELWNSIIEKD